MYGVDGVIDVRGGGVEVRGTTRIFGARTSERIVTRKKRYGDLKKSI